MKSVAVVMLAALSVAELRQRLVRDTNSYQASVRGVKSYASQQYAGAVQAFATAAGVAPQPVHAFNLGTAQIAAGQRAEGSATIEKAMSDQSLRPSALYNRGNSALASKSWDHAVRDYSESLRLRPSDPQAKRNLEIALQRQMAEQQAGRRKPQQEGSSPQQQPKEPQTPQEDGKEQEQEGDAEALLRSVQQQEQEEMQRMKRARARPARVGW